VDRFSDKAAHLQLRTADNHLPGPNEPVDFDSGPFITQGLSPTTGKPVRYYNFDVQTTTPAPVYVLYREGEDKPVAGQLDIIDTLPGEKGYNDFRQVWKVSVPKDYVANSIADTATLLNAGYQMQQTGTLRNMPVVPDKSQARARLNGESAELHRAWYRGQVAKFFSFDEAPLSAAGPNVPLSPIYVTFNVNPGQEVLVDRIKISGNTKTSDKVIRRELQVQEQEPYSAEKIRISKARLDRLGIFEQTRINTAPGREPDRINLNVGVREGQTGSFQLAGGFDTASSVFGNFRLSESNLFGGGQSISFDVMLGFLFQNFTVSYNEPYFLDMPLNLGVDLFSWKMFLQAFNQSSVGFAIRSSYPLTDLGLKKLGPLPLEYVSVGLGYRWESIGISGLQPLTTYDVRRYKGYTLTSKISPTIRRYTVDNPVDPRHGSIQSLSVDIAGLGGDNYFVKGLAHARFFFSFIDSPAFGNWVYSIGGDYGIGTNLQGGTGGELPLYERFFPGGINSVRGYKFYSLGPRVVIHDVFGQPIAYDEVGGSKELLLNTEVTFPILEALGLRGVVFLDAGNAYRLQESMDLGSIQAAYGMGIRWRSPFGPLRIEFGRPINPRPNDLRTDFIIGAGGNL